MFVMFLASSYSTISLQRAQEFGHFDGKTTTERAVNTNTDINRPSSTECSQPGPSSTLRAITIHDIEFLITCCSYLVVGSVLVMLCQNIRKHMKTLPKLVKCLGKLVIKLILLMLMMIAKLVVKTWRFIVSAF